MLGLGLAGEGGVVDLGDLRVGDPLLAVLVEDRVGVVDRGPGLSLDAGDRLADSLVLPGGDREARVLPERGSDHVVAVVGRVGPQYQHATGAGLARRPQRIGDKTVGSAGRVRRALAQPGGSDHRRRRRRRDDRQQRVQGLDAGVAAASALLGVAAGLAQRVIDIDVGQLVGAGQQRRLASQIDQQPAANRVELPDMADGETA